MTRSAVSYSHFGNTQASVWLFFSSSSHLVKSFFDMKVVYNLAFIWSEHMVWQLWVQIIIKYDIWKIYFNENCSTQDNQDFLVKYNSA